MDNLPNRETDFTIDNAIRDIRIRMSCYESLQISKPRILAKLKDRYSPEILFLAWHAAVLADK